MKLLKRVIEWFKWIFSYGIEAEIQIRPEQPIRYKKNWTKQEEELVKNTDDVNLPDLTELLGRSLGAIIAKKKRLNRAK